MTAPTHTGRRARVGHYATTADARRKPGVWHALTAIPHSTSYRALCGEIVPQFSGDEFAGDNPIYPVGQKPVTCRRCLAKMK